MKILLITPRFYPEPFTISRIAEELVNRGHQITVLTGNRITVSGTFTLDTKK